MMPSSIGRKIKLWSPRASKNVRSTGGTGAPMLCTPFTAAPSVTQGDDIEPDHTWIHGGSGHDNDADSGDEHVVVDDSE